ncbi:MAG TPA: L-serine ammonia-lyase, iron-sulfur-dependent, subunit alpha [Candidatus Methanofastidiosa archaeon]|nr:L-serine ammonia-lyase, iron-sulfur-dependent, subunit alpha [Candidatus Methanofastidiosa archaeon]
MKEKIDIMSFLEDNVIPAAGCTEIVAIGISTCAGFGALTGNLPNGALKTDAALPDPEKVELIELILDKRLYKNAYSVNIPCTGGMNGIELAAAIGLFLNINRSKPLEIFTQIEPQSIELAKRVLDKVSVSIDNGKGSLFVKATIMYDGHTIVSTMEGAHDRITSIIVDGKAVFSNPLNKLSCADGSRISELSINEMMDLIVDIPTDVKAELSKTIDLNMALVVEGLCHFSSKGGIVHILKGLIHDGLLSDDIKTKIMISVASAVEARMGGVPLSAMSSSGSGNMGITATVPIIIVGQELDRPDEDVLKAILISHLVVSMASDKIGRLSALCGASNKSSFGAAAGMAFLLGAGPDGIINSINMVASNLIGATCDGAKTNCALKAMSSASMAYESALMGSRGLRLDSQGIVGDNAKETLSNVSEISHMMDSIDDAIVKILKQRVKR